MTPFQKAHCIYNRFHAVLSYALVPGQKEYAETLKGYETLGKLISDSAFYIHEQAKKCAILHVEEIMLDQEEFFNEDEKNYEHTQHYKFHMEIKEELNKL